MVAKILLTLLFLVFGGLISKTTQKYFVDGRLAYPNDETKRNSRKFVKALRPLRVRAALGKDPSPLLLVRPYEFCPLNLHLQTLAPLLCSQDYVVPVSSAPESLAFAEAFADLLSRLFAYDPKYRISAADALDHAYFKYEVDEAGQVLSAP